MIPIEGMDYRVNYCALGPKVHEAVTIDKDGFYTIFIDKNLCQDKQHKVLQHVLNHIKNNDFEKFDVQEIEFNAHKQNGEKL